MYLGDSAHSFLRQHAATLLDSQFHGTAAPTLIGLRRLGALEPLRVLLEERGVVPFCGELWDSRAINEHTSWVDFPLVDEALVYARTYGRWDPHAADERLSPLRRRMRALRQATYPKLSEEERALVDDPFEVLLMTEITGAKRVFAHTPEWALRGCVPLAGITFFVPLASAPHAVRLLGADLAPSIHPLEHLETFVRACAQRRELWHAEERERIDREVHERTARDWNRGHQHRHHLEYLFLEEQRAAILAELGVVAESERDRVEG